jgi:hypothetical protein
VKINGQKVRNTESRGRRMKQRVRREEGEQYEAESEKRRGGAG